MSAQPSFQTERAPVALALLGTGQVGAAFAARVAKLAEARREPLSLRYVANTRGAAQVASGASADATIATLRTRARTARDARPPELPPGAIVVDATASAEIAAAHPRWLARGHAVVSANKLGLAGPLARFLEIRGARAAAYGDSATVGAGLPLLRTVRELRAGGDRVHAIAGVLSGSLAWLFDGYDGSESFAARVRRAAALGYTEPDPRVDLAGEDVRRKLLILARTAGFALEPEQVTVDSLVPPALACCEPEDVGAHLDTLDPAIERRAATLLGDGRVLRYVARFDADGARVGLEALRLDDPLAQGRGCDNRVAISSCRYSERPIVIQGPGAGAEVTAAALLDDVLRIARLHA